MVSTIHQPLAAGKKPTPKAAAGAGVGSRDPYNTAAMKAAAAAAAAAKPGLIDVAALPGAPLSSEVAASAGMVISPNMTPLNMVNLTKGKARCHPG